MPRHTLLAPVLALLLASPAVLAQDAPTPAPAPHSQTAHGPGHGSMEHRMHRMRREHRPEMGVIADLHALERLYRRAGHEKELTGVYNEVLAKSQNPRLRTYAYHRLAQLEAQPTNVDEAAATLRKSLSENLDNEAKQQAERTRMRALWKQRAAASQPASR